MVSTGCLLKRPVSVNVFIFLLRVMVGGAVSPEMLVCRPQLESGLVDFLLPLCGLQPVLPSLTPDTETFFLHTPAVHWIFFPFSEASPELDAIGWKLV